MVRREEQEWQSRCTLLIDNRRISHRGYGVDSSMETAVRAAASIMRNLVALDFEVRLVSATGHSSAHGWHQAAHGATLPEQLERLALMRMTRTEQLSTGWVDESHHGGMLLAVLGHLGEGDRSFLAGLATAGASAYAVVLDVSTWTPSDRRSPRPPPRCVRAGGRRPPSNATVRCPPRGWGWRDDLASPLRRGPAPGTTAPAMAARGWHPGPPLLGLFAGWVALFSWSGMVAKPLGLPDADPVRRSADGAGRQRAADDAASRRTPWRPCRSSIALLSLNVIFAAGLSRLGVIPTDGLRARGRARHRQRRSDPEHLLRARSRSNPTHTAAMLMACGLAVLLSIDVLAMGLRRPPLVALPLLVTLSIPVSILNGPIALPVFVGTALLFLRLVATENLERFAGLGSRDDARRPSRCTRRCGRSRSWLSCVALLVAPLVPVADLLDDTPGGDGPGEGGSGYHLTSVNPFIRLRRDLVEKTHTPMVYAETEARSTSYLRTTVLDRFTDDEWRPSPRALPSDNRADGAFPNPPGLAPGVTGAEDTGASSSRRTSAATWLPLPYPVRELDIEGSWRFDARTLDVAFVGGGPPQELEYGATSFTPSVTAELLDVLGRAAARPGSQAPMTAVPDDPPGRDQDPGTSR